MFISNEQLGIEHGRKLCITLLQMVQEMGNFTIKSIAV